MDSAIVGLDLRRYMPTQEQRIAHIEALAQAIVKDAETYGMVVTIETVPTQPLRMGGHRMVVHVREARKLAPTLTGGGDD